MATAVTTPPPPSSSSSSCGPKLESLANIDITKLSQSELYTLSKCSNSAFDLHRSDDVVVPNIDRSLFNESSGSRRQTYSRLRQSHHHHHHLHPRTRLPGLLPGPKHSPSADPENHAILHYLKHYLNHNSATNCPPPPPPPPLPPRPPPPPPQPVGLGLQEKMAIAVNVVEKKRKRGGKVRWNPGLLENGVGMELERVNKNGLEVDFAALESNGDEFYSAELGRRTMGLETEEGVLEFLRGLEGQWCSRRKKRKYVDAGDFGDALPIGWKLLLGLRRRDGRVWVYCRRIIRDSP
ncbi:methyl-CpG-binding domain-containing protein 8-like isoform X2 [Coffea arabica]|uniref:Methyl-CpG-binding domain-containing protein 8-like isoform X2 n=1 Tax=Coffea arabica TaxID=13443 RepID=A0ABM4WVB7_COFAR